MHQVITKLSRGLKKGHQAVRGLSLLYKKLPRLAGPTWNGASSSVSSVAELLNSDRQISNDGIKKTHNSKGCLAPPGLSSGTHGHALPAVMCFL